MQALFYLFGLGEGGRTIDNNNSAQLPEGKQRKANALKENDACRDPCQLIQFYKEGEMNCSTYS